MRIWLVRVAVLVVVVAAGAGLWFGVLRRGPTQVWVTQLHDCPDKVTWLGMRTHLGKSEAVDLPETPVDEYISCPLEFSPYQPEPWPVHMIAGSADFNRYDEWLREGRQNYPCPDPYGIQDGLPDSRMMLARIGTRTYIVNYPRADCD